VLREPKGALKHETCMNNSNEMAKTFICKKTHDGRHETKDLNR
jgi:hypothetical protein